MTGDVRILGIVGSPRHGNTEILIKEALNASEEVGGVETEILHVAHLKIHPCIACFRCFDEKESVRGCPSFDDDMENVYPRLAACDGMIIGSPVYFGGNHW